MLYINIIIILPVTITFKLLFIINNKTIIQSDMRSVSIIMGLLLPTYCLLAPPHPKGFVIVIIPVNISIKIIPDCYLVNRSDSFFQLDHLLSLKVGYKKAGSKMPRRPFLEISSNLFDNRP